MAIVWTDLVAATTIASGDILCAVDISDSSQSPEGSSKQYTHAALLARGTITTSDPMSFTQTWNAGGVTFAGVQVKITNTASAAASLPFEVLGGAAGATSLFSVRIDGLATFANTVNATTFVGALTGNASTASAVAAANLTGTTLAAGVVTSSLTTVGTIASGVWNGTAVDATHGGTNQTSWTSGDILYASGANTLAKLAKGSDGQYLKLASGLPSWAAAAVTSPLQIDQVYARKGSSGSVASSGTYTFTPTVGIAALFMVHTSSPNAQKSGLGLYMVTGASTGLNAVITTIIANPSVSVAVSSGDIIITNIAGVTITFDWATLNLVDPYTP